MIMPMYVYEVITADGRGGETFEMLQSIHAETLTKHPETGQPVRRVVTAPHVPKKNTDGKIKADLSDKNLDRLGFTKYVKSSSGNYEKTAGAGPDLISRD
jgi:predicted nucleic acid-binding Zn ribbon protein